MSIPIDSGIFGISEINIELLGDTFGYLDGGFRV